MSREHDPTSTCPPRPAYGDITHGQVERCPTCGVLLRAKTRYDYGGGGPHGFYWVKAGWLARRLYERRMRRR